MSGGGGASLPNRASILTGDSNDAVPYRLLPIKFSEIIVISPIRWNGSELHVKTRRGHVYAPQMESKWTPVG